MGQTKTQIIGETVEKPKAKRAPKKDKVEKIADAMQIEPKSKEKRAKSRSKRFKEAKSKVDRSRLYSLKDAVKLAKETSISTFDGTLELHLVVRKEGLSVNVELPHSTGKSKKIEVADEKTLAKLKEGVVDFDVLLATADMMPKLVPFARLLGPKGLMPNPKNGTIIKTAKDKDKFNADKITIKTEKKAPVIHAVCGKVSMKDEEVIENVQVIFAALTTRQILKAYIASSMGPSVKVSID